MNTKICEKENLFEIKASHSFITRICFDSAVTFESLDGASHWIIRIEEPFSIASDKINVICSTKNIDSVCPALHLLNKEMERFYLWKNGELEIYLVDNIRINVSANDLYESWEIYGPNEIRIVSMPGGGLNTWGMSGG